MILSENRQAVSVRTPLNDDALMLVQAFFLALESNGGHYLINYLVIKDFCEKHEIESLEILAACKSFLGVIPRWQTKKLK